MTRRFSNSTFKHVWAFIITIFLYSTAFAQQGIPLTLKEALDNALNNNREIQIGGYDEQMAVERYRQTKAVFLPQVEASYTALATDNPLNAFGFKLQQQIIASSDFDPQQLNHPSETYDFMAKLEIRQPILNIDRLYERKAAKRQSELYRFKTQRTRQYVTFEVQKAYLKLQFASHIIKVMDEALQTARSVYSFTHKRYEKGLLQKSDVLNAQVQVNTLETKLAEAKSNLQNTSEEIALLMGKPSPAPYQPTEAWPADTANNTLTPVLPGSRADFMALQKAADAAQLAIISGKASYLPRINAFASYQVNDSKPAGFNAGSHFAGVQLSWNLFNGTQTHHQVAQQRLEHNKLVTQLNLQKEQALLELTRTQRSIADSYVKVQQQKSTVDQSDEALRILQNRYDQGLVNTTDILMAQSQLSQHQLGYEQALLEMNMAIAYRQFLTCTENEK